MHKLRLTGKLTSACFLRIIMLNINDKVNCYKCRKEMYVWQAFVRIGNKYIHKECYLDNLDDSNHSYIGYHINKTERKINEIARK